MAESLRNKGILLLNEKKDRAKNSTVIVTGIARGGTSMIASIVDSLGVYIGDKRDEIVYEDIEISNAYESANYILLNELITKRNSSHELWGFKRPSYMHYWKSIEKYFSNPMYIVTVRDPLAVATRNMISMNQPIIKSLEKCIEIEYKILLKFVSQTKQPILLISYEKALRYPKHIINEIINFLNLPKDNYDINQIISVIKPENKAYLEKTRLNSSAPSLLDFRYIGRLDKISDNTVYGWCKSTDSNEPINVKLIINDSYSITVSADKGRNDLLSVQLGNCAFEYNHPKDIRINTVKAYISDTKTQLKNSPISI